MPSPSRATPDCDAYGIVEPPNSNAEVWYIEAILQQAGYADECQITELPVREQHACSRAVFSGMIRLRKCSMSVGSQDTETYDERARRGGAQAMRDLGRFFMKEDEVYQSLLKLAARLTELKIPYAVAGAMALNAHGYRRATLDIDVLVDRSGLAEIHENLEGLGYVAPFAGSKNLRDAQTTARIEFLVTGQYPGDGKPKPVAFPPPQDVAIEIDGVRYVRLPTLVELKLASGMTNPARLKDLADVQELIQVLNLPLDFARQLDPYVRDEYARLWNTVRQAPKDIG